MTGLSVTQKYGSLLQDNLGVNKNAEITSIGSQSLQITQRGNSWHGRLVCWVKDNVSPMFRKQSRSPKSGFNSPVLQKLSEDIRLDHSMGEDAKTAILDRVSSLDASGIPVRIKHLRKLLGDVNVRPDVLQTIVSLPDNPGEIQARTGSTASSRLNDGTGFTVRIEHLAVGGEEYVTALQELAQGQGLGDFNDNHLAEKTGLDAEALLGQNPQFAGTAELDVGLREIWEGAVQQAVGGLSSPTIPEAQLKSISDQVIDELCDEIKGGRTMNNNDLDKLKLTTQGDIADEALRGAMQRTGLKFAENPSPGKKSQLRNDVQARMTKDRINEDGQGRFYPQTPEKALDKIILSLAEASPALFQQG